MADKKPTGLDLLREPFPAHQISKLPKPFKKDSPKGKCAECGGYHGLPAMHLDYVGHAALTDRLLECDAYWKWEPVAFGPDGLPALDKIGGLWIRLTVCDHTRLGYGHADGKTGGDAIKEAIGDALRNAAMRFGAALDLWHKGDLHGDDDDGPMVDPKREAPPPFDPVAAHDRIAKKLEGVTTLADLAEEWRAEAGTIKEVTEARADLGKSLTATKDRLKAELAPKGDADAKP